MQHWQQDSDLAGVRDAAALEKLPAEERAACAKLWADVAALLKKAEGKNEKIWRDFSREGGLSYGGAAPPQRGGQRGP
jgi:hypothetical protein